jgi:hypothetical protein
MQIVFHAFVIDKGTLNKFEISLIKRLTAFFIHQVNNERIRSYKQFHAAGCKKLKLLTVPLPENVLRNFPCFNLDRPKSPTCKGQMAKDE